MRSRRTTTTLPDPGRDPRPRPGAAPPRAPRSAPGLPDVLTRGVALGTAGAAAVHLVVARHHLWLPWVAAGFVAMALAQLAVAALLTRSPRPARWLRASVAVNLGVVAVWAVSRTVGLPFVPGGEGVQPLEIPDLITTALELLTVATAVVVLRRPAALAARVLGSTAAWQLSAAVVAVVVWMVAAAMLVPHDHGPPGVGRGDLVIEDPGGRAPEGGPRAGTPGLPPAGGGGHRDHGRP